MFRVAAPRSIAHARASPVDVETPWNTSSTVSGQCSSSIAALAAKPSDASTTACGADGCRARRSRAPHATTAAVVDDESDAGGLVDEGDVRSARRSPRAGCARSTGRPARPVSVCSRGTDMPCRAHVVADLDGVAELVGEPLDVGGRHGAHGLDERHGSTRRRSRGRCRRPAAAASPRSRPPPASACPPARGCRSTPACCSRSCVLFSKTRDARRRLRAARSAATMPAAPPPTTATSTSTVTGSGLPAA